jgi:phage baseplate assembly protein W
MSFDFKLVAGSFSFGSDGEVSTVTHNEKLGQDVIRIIATAIGENKIHQWYGTSIQDKIVGTGLPRSIIKEDIESTVRFALENLKSIQEQSERAGQALSPREAISKIEDVSALDTTDPRQIVIRISIRTRSGNRLQEDIPLNL